VNGHSRCSPQRSRLAYEAARILAEQGDQAFDRARRKAAERTGIANRREWPSNEEILDALTEQRRLFQGDRFAADLYRLREQAAKAMGVFDRFLPRLVGPAFSGTGNLRQGVRMHLFADSPEDLVFALIDQGIPWQQCEEALRYGGGVRRTHPAFAFVAGEIPFTLVVLPPTARRNPPLDPVSERPEHGADIETLRRMLQQAAPKPAEGRLPHQPSLLPDDHARFSGRRDQRSDRGR
jgi:hypothetical protein